MPCVDRGLLLPPNLGDLLVVVMEVGGDPLAVADHPSRM
jgi:hypothetical protein